MKKFQDLVFEPHELGDVFGGARRAGVRAQMTFPNGYGVSVIRGWFARGNLYEVAILRDGVICYTSGLTEDVIAHCDVADVADIMDRVQRLPREER